MDADGDDEADEDDNDKLRRKNIGLRLTLGRQRARATRAQAAADQVFDSQRDRAVRVSESFAAKLQRMGDQTEMVTVATSSSTFSRVRRNVKHTRRRDHERGVVSLVAGINKFLSKELSDKQHAI